MGVLRSVPQKAENCSLQDFTQYFCVTASACGWQIFMEDFQFSFHYSDHVHVMGILDGSAGPEIAHFCNNSIEHIIRNCELMKLQQYQPAIQNLCFTLDDSIKNHHQTINQIRLTYNLPELPSTEDFLASTSLVICIIDEESVTIGNLGECKSYVSYKNSPQTFVLISGSHVIQTADETDTIAKKGGFMADNLINGKFLHTKGIGNLKYKNLNNEGKSLLSSQPSVFTLKVEDINAVVMGSSGLWEGPEKVLRDIFEEKLNPIEQKQNIRSVVNSLIAEWGEDELGKQNMTVKAIFFDR